MKNLSLFLCLSFWITSAAVAQTNTSSPYSMFGIGDIKPLGFGRNAGIAGAGIAMPSDLSLNNINPASYYAIDSLAFKLETGLDMKVSRFKSGQQLQTNNNVNFSYLAVGFRNNSWWANSLGIVPYSSVGNDINTTKNIEGTTDYMDVNVEGTGGLNQFYWGNSFKIMPKLAVGINFSFLFGTINQTQNLTTSSISGTLKTEDKIYLSKLCLSYGFQYMFNVSDKVQATVGGILGTSNKLNLRHEITSTDNESNILEEKESRTSIFTLPAYRGLGVALKFSNNLTITSDYKFYNWSKSESFQSNVKLVNSDIYILGAEYSPARSFRSSYIKKLRYRLGGYYSNSYMMIKSHQLHDKGLSVGIGLPLMNKTFINLTYSAGIKDAGKATGIISETYHTIAFNFSFIDLWFVKPKFD